VQRATRAARLRFGLATLDEQVQTLVDEVGIAGRVDEREPQLAQPLRDARGDVVGEQQGASIAGREIAQTLHQRTQSPFVEPRRVLDGPFLGPLRTVDAQASVWTLSPGGPLACWREESRLQARSVERRELSLERRRCALGLLGGGSFLGACHGLVFNKLYCSLRMNASFD